MSISDFGSVDLSRLLEPSVKSEIYLIFNRHAHSVIHFVQAACVSEAIWNYIHYQCEDAILQPDGSVREENRHYSDVLDYIESDGKKYGEWQIRKMPEWAWEQVREGQVVEAFCGESEDSPAEVIAECRKRFVQDFPRSRAKAFIWYLNQGDFVTFYRKRGVYNITVVKRYLCTWSSQGLLVEDWAGDNKQIVESLYLEPWRSNDRDSSFRETGYS